MKYYACFNATVLEGRVNRCQGTGLERETPQEADADGKADGRPYVVTDQAGAVVELHAPEPVSGKKKK